MTKSRNLLILLFLSAAFIVVSQECTAGDTTCSDQQADNTEEECKDTDSRCSLWASKDECANNPNYMHIYCPMSCNTCQDVYEKNEEEERLSREVADYGEPQKVEGKDAAKTLEVIKKTVEYMKEVVNGEGYGLLSDEIKAECTNKDKCE